jgi:hypothetical protein
MAKIGDLLVDLSEDPRLLREFERDAEKVMRERGLSENQRQILRDGNLKRVRQELEAENPDATVFVALLRPIH